MKKIKIRPKYRKRTYDEIVIPEIKMEGKWLKESGFVEGSYVYIHIQRNKLIITLSEELSDSTL